MDVKSGIIRLLAKAMANEASDLHLINKAPPFLRVHGEIILMDEEPLNPEQNKKMIYSLLNEVQKKKFEDEWELCVSCNIPDVGYFRINVYLHKGMVEASIRLGMTELKTFEELGIPEQMKELIQKPIGLLLVTGPTGQGKTTTFNSLINFINRDRRCKIITVEDPVEYLHKNVKSVIVQQQVHSDTKSFHQAIIHILRQDPDIIGIGEMRDLETISTAITAAETGHLVLATLHTN
ncbi:MAG: type IV pili twitching motility protein PilT, partial [Candidatus Schekmanbacteria bacterium RBG_13_48_7]